MPRNVGGPLGGSNGMPVEQKQNIPQQNIPQHNIPQGLFATGQAGGGGGHSTPPGGGSENAQSCMGMKILPEGGINQQLTSSPLNGPLVATKYGISTQVIDESFKTAHVILAMPHSPASQLHDAQTHFNIGDMNQGFSVNAAYNGLQR